MTFPKTIVASWIAAVLCTVGCTTLTPTKPIAPPHRSRTPQTNAVEEPTISLPEGDEGNEPQAVSKPGTSLQGVDENQTSSPQSERVVRGQSPRNWFAPINEPTAGSSDHWRRPMQVSGEPVTRGQSPGYGYPVSGGYAPQNGYYDSPVAQMVQNPFPSRRRRFPVSCRPATRNH